MLKKQQGFTIIEVVVVIAVFAISMSTLVMLMSSIQVAQRNAYYMSIATHAARAEVERLRSSGYSSIQAGNTYPFSQVPGALPPGSTGSIVVSTPANAPTSKQVDATVTYSIGTLSKQVTISAYVDPPKVSQ